MARQESVSALTAQVRSYPEEVWQNDLKAAIKVYYIDQNMSLKDTLTKLKDHDYYPSEKMCKTRFKKWEGFDKYINTEKAQQTLQAVANSQNGLHRSSTTKRNITEEQAKKHLKRKKIHTMPVQQDHFDFQLNTDNPIIIPESETLLSPDGEIVPYYNNRFDISDIYNGGMLGMRHQHVAVPFPMHEDSTSDEEDEEMMDVDEGPLVQARDPVNSSQQYSNELVRRGGFSVHEKLVNHPNLEFATASFLFSMRDFCDMSLATMPMEQVGQLSTQRFNKIWDLFCTQAAHIQQNRNKQALMVSGQAEMVFSKMLNAGDPWLLLSVCLVLNDNMSNPERISASTSFLASLAAWATAHFPQHPIVQSIQFLQRTDHWGVFNEYGVYLLEATVRMLTERLDETIGRDHDLSLEIHRLHARILTTIGNHATAERLLTEDLAAVESKYGSSSLQNLLRLSSLARCKYMAKDFQESKRLYIAILNDPLVNESWLGDIKYGAMYFVAKSNADLNHVSMAIAQAQEALRFSLETKGSDHYWANNARELINELEMRSPRVFDME